MAAEPEHMLSKSRMEALTDGLFATVMTILVLSLVVPLITGANLPQQLDAYIASLLPYVFVYIASFVVLGVMWVGHNNLFRYLHNVNYKIIWVNIFLLLFTGFVPFSTAFLGRYPLQQPTILVYGVNFLCLAILFNVLTKKVVRQHKSLHRGDDGLKGLQKSNMLSLAIYPLSMALSFVSPYISLGLFMLMPIYYISRAIRIPS